MELHVHSPAFDKECAVYSKRLGNVPLSDDSGIDYSSDHSSLWENDSSSSSSSVSSVESSPYEVPKLEAYLYYFGLRGPRRRGPKLIFRTSKDVFTAPSGPEQECRQMQLRPVYAHHIFSEGDLWPTIRSEVVKLLDQRNIQHSSVDLVRFSWVKDDEKNEDDEENEDDEDDGGDEDDSDIEDSDIKLSPYGTVVTTPVTIWVGVLPDTLTGEVAFNSSNDILDLLKEHGISDVDIAYRNNGFYFKVGQDLYAVTARHVLFPENEGNNTYSEVAGPKKKVVLMGNKAFHNFLVSIQGHIGVMNTTVDVLEKRAARELEETQRELTKTRVAIEELKKFFVKTKKQWTRPKDRVIGHVVWAPPVSVHTAPHSYTVDVCVIKLDKRKFLQNFRGNVLDLGPEIDPAKFISLMYPRIDAPSDFDYPVERLLKLRGILSAEEIRTPDNRDHRGDPMRYVIKRGYTTLTTIGCLNGFESHVRRYFALSIRDSVEAAVYPYDNNSGPFSRGGDSGSIIVDALGKFVALLIGGTGPTGSSDITFGTPMHWLWDVIETQFPGADLYFEDDDN